jgi:hypothetical protein
VSQSEQPIPNKPGAPSAAPFGGPTPGHVAEAVADLAGRLGVDPREITVVSQEEVTWPDASLGCPEPGMLYAQVLTDGIRIVLESDGRRYDYHSGGQLGPFWCESRQR